MTLMLAWVALLVAVLGNAVFFATSFSSVQRRLALVLLAWQLVLFGALLFVSLAVSL